MRTTMLALMPTVLAMGTPAAAQMAEPAPCATPVPPPPAFAGWSRAVRLADGAPLAVGQAATLTLAAAPHFAIPPGHVPAPGSFGGTLRLTVAAAGTYRIALGSALWIDMVAGGKPLASVAHDRGPACSPVRKIVDFRLTPGTYVVQLSGSTTPMASVMAVRG